MNDINNYGRIIYYVITYLILVAAIILIIDEIFRMSVFCYNYTYNYNYGKINENLCKNDENTAVVEYEKARFRVLNSLNKYKFEKDLFNKNWINYLNYLIIIIFTILIILSFAILFYYYYIYNVQNCTDNPHEADMSVIKLLIKCMFGDLHRFIPNCMIDYSILLIITIVYPSIVLLKSFLNIDFTWKSGFWSKGFHIFFSVILFTYVLKLLREKTMTTDENGKSEPLPIKIKYLKILVYLSFMGIFYLAQYIHLNSYDDYNSQFKIADIYNNPDDKNDTMFFDVYKQTEPQKPQKPPILNELKLPAVGEEEKNLLTDFVYCSTLELNKATIPPKCLGKLKTNYDANLKKLDNYYKKKKEYDENMKKYTNKYNIYKNNKINFPEILTIFQGIIPKFLGFENYTFQLIYVMIAIFALIYGIIRFFESSYSDFYYNTIIIYLIGLITIFILTNSILTYNTFFNKYHIYEPISNYKYDLFKMNLLFDITLTNATTQDDENKNKKKLYNIISNNKKTFYIGDNQATSTAAPTKPSIDTIINDIKTSGSLYNTETNIIIASTINIKDTSIIDIPAVPTETATETATKQTKADFYKKLNLTKLWNAIHIGLLSELLYLKDINKDDYDIIDNIYINTNSTKYFWDNISIGLVNYKKFMFYYSNPLILIDKDSLENATTNNLTANFYTFIQMIKGTAVNNVNNIDNKIRRVIDNIEYLVYENHNLTKSTPSLITNQRLLLNLEGTNQNFYMIYLLNESKRKEELGEIEDNSLIEYYKYNLGIINEIGNYYSEFLLKVRDLVIGLFNSSSIYCDTQTTDINLFKKVDAYLVFMTTGSKYDRKFKTQAEENKIEIYKKILKDKIKEFNDLYFKYFNIIKILIFNKIKYIDTTSEEDKKIFDEVKSIYNIHAGNEKRYNENEFINDNSITITENEFFNKYINLNTKEKELLSYNTDSVSWGFVVLVIIFAIILLEPTII